MHIGLFDSGVGGLTVLKELVKEFPKAKFTYLGDTARLPYGNKAPETLEKYSLENMEFLASKKVDAIVVACHSASSVCLEMNLFKKIPVFNVISPSCKEALETSKSKKIGVMATKATIRSQVYPSYINQLDPSAQVIGQECPLLVPLVEEELSDDEITEIILKRYLKPLQAGSVDTILLGCTHYPILKDSISSLCPDITLIDPARSVALKLRELFDDSKDEESPMDIFLTDHSPHFITHAQSILGENLKHLIHYPNS